MAEELTGLQRTLATIFDTSAERMNFESLRVKTEGVRSLERDRKQRLAFFITSQIEGFERVGEFLATNAQTFERLKSLSLRVKAVSQQNVALSRLEPEKMRRISTVKRNLTLILEKLNDFIGVNQKLEELELLQAEEANFLLVQDRLEALLSLERTLQGQEGAGKFREKFVQVHEFRSRFMQKVMATFDDYIEVCRERPESLRRAVEVADRADQAAHSEEHLQEVLERLGAGVVRRFEVRLGDRQEIHLLLENIKFSVDDLLVVYEYLQPLFSPRYQLFAFMENAYKAQIELKVLPFVQDFSYLKENPGTLVYLINWLNTYEKLLTKVGFASLSFAGLRERIRASMPFFTAHVEKMFSDYLKNIEKNDQALFSGESPEGTLETSTPEDILHFLNEQIAFLGRYLDEELMTRLLAVWLGKLREFALETTERFAAAVEAPENLVLLCVGLNNFSKLCAHLGASRKSATTLFATEVGRERLGQLFAGLTTALNQQIEVLLGKMTLVTFADVERQKFPLLFKESWAGDPAATVLNTLGDYQAALAPQLLNKVHAKLYLRRMIERYFVCYFEQFTWSVKNAFHKEALLEGYRPESLRVEAEKEEGRKAMQTFLRRAEKVQQLLARDAESFRAFFAPLRPNFSEAFAQTVALQAEYVKARLFAPAPPTSIASGSPQLEQATAFLRERLR